ncbi:MAG TPA: hypothetical protein VGN88_14220 [Phycisphaerae bacterium]|jgi:uncharacterized membrane protein
MGLPPTPPWEGFHVLLVHFPIGLLLVSPVLMVLAIFLQKRMPGIGFSAWVVLLLGTFSAWMAMRSGEAAYQATGEMTQAARDVMEVHQRMGEKVPWIFTGLLVGYGLVLILPVVVKKVKGVPFRVVGTLIVLGAYGWGAAYLANTAHLGGSLVHDHGVTAVTAEKAAHGG